MIRIFIYLERATSTNPMEALFEIRARRKQLLERYKTLMEEAYNWRQSDSALSDISEFDALRLLDKLNHLQFLDREALQNN